ALDSIAIVLYSVAWMGAIVAIGIAILKYHLWAVDLVISRTLTYGFLVVLIAFMYVAVLAGVSTLVGQTAGLPLTTAVTMLVAIAFQPVRSRLQQVANRIVYG